MTSYITEHRSYHGSSSMVPVPVHQENHNVIVLEDTPPEFITVVDGKNTNERLLEANKINVDHDKQFKKLKPKVRLHITVFSIIAGLALITSVIIFLNFWSSDSSVGEIWSANTKTELKVMSALDFKLLEPFHTSLNILGIDEKYEDFSFLQLTMSGNNVQHIRISGTISFQWFYFITRQFPAVRSVNIDMDEYCSGTISFKDKTTTFQGIKFTVRNLKECNYNVYNVYLSLQFPGLKYLIIQDSDLFFESYMVWIKLLKRNFGVSFPNPKGKKISRRKVPFAEVY